MTSIPILAAGSVFPAILFASLLAQHLDPRIFIDCHDVAPGIPACSGNPPLASGRIAFVAQPGPDQRPEIAQIARLDAEGVWHPESVGRLGSPKWSPSGRFLAWDRWRPFHPPMAYAWPDRALVTDAEGRPLEAYEAARLDVAGLPFLSAQQSAEGVESLLLRDSTNLIALPLPSGRPRRMPIPPGWVRSFDWLLSDDGSLLALRHLRSRQDPERPQHPAIWERWWDGAWEGMALQDTGPSPNMQLFDWSLDERWLLAAEIGHIYSNSQPRYYRFVRIDRSTGGTAHLSLRATEIHVLFARGAHWRPWRPDGGNQLIIPGMPEDGSRSDGTRGEISRLALVDLDDASLRWLTDERLLATSPAWSPDGRRVAFAAIESERELPGAWPMMGLRDTFQARRGMALYLLDVESGGLRQITEPGEAWDSGPEWSADGSRLLYQRGFDPSEGDSSLSTRYQVRVWMLADGSDELLLDHVDSDWAWWEGGR